ncbi:hypothetical protein [[Kitasatospora] papulosa]
MIHEAHVITDEALARVAGLVAKAASAQRCHFVLVPPPPGVGESGFPE